jgi:hypothetical protein
MKLKNEIWIEMVNRLKDKIFGEDYYWSETTSRYYGRKENKETWTNLIESLNNIANNEESISIKDMNKYNRKDPIKDDIWVILLFGIDYKKKREMISIILWIKLYDIKKDEFIWNDLKKKLRF